MGASLLAIAVGQATGFLSDRPPSRAGSLPQLNRCSAISDRDTPRSPARYPAPAPVSLRPARCPGATR
ncbi:hypothetical protein C4E44_17400 [Pseudomonas sp. MWU12-2312b]|nr:hypothetical protein C4E44_17400 [Pseudomonas sp. MWU12-2312b]